MPNRIKEQLARLFIETKAFKEDLVQGFKLSSGDTSPFYVDCKALMGTPEPRQLVARLACELVDDQALEFEVIGGLEIGAIAIATAISDYAFNLRPKREWRTFVVRKNPKEHGLRNLIEGPFNRGDRAVIVDDVLTTGGSVIKAVAAARHAGLTVNYALVIVDRNEKNGKANVEREKVRVLSLLTIEDLRNVSKKKREELIANQV